MIMVNFIIETYRKNKFVGRKKRMVIINDFDYCEKIDEKTKTSDSTQKQHNTTNNHREPLTKNAAWVVHFYELLVLLYNNLHLVQYRIFENLHAN